MEAQSAEESVSKRGKNTANKQVDMFSILRKTHPRRGLSVSLSPVKIYIYPSQIRTELMAYLLWELFLDMFFDPPDLPPACICPSNTKGREGKVIQLFKLGYATNCL